MCFQDEGLRSLWNCLRIVFSEDARCLLKAISSLIILAIVESNKDIVSLRFEMNSWLTANRSKYEAKHWHFTNFTWCTLCHHVYLPIGYGDDGFLLGIFSGGGKIYCYANFFCYAIVFGPNFREGQKFSGGQTAAPPPRGRKPVTPPYLPV